MPLTLHFDVSDGATAEVINASLRSLLGPSKNTYEFDLDKSKNTQFGLWKNGAKSSLDEVINFVGNSNFEPQVKAVAIRTLQELLKSFRISKPSKQVLTSSVLCGILTDVVEFSFFVSQINPVAISCTKIPLSWPIKKIDTNKNQAVDEKSWILELVLNIPTIEQDWPASYCDAAGLAMLKTVCSTFGSRGESILKQTALGIAKNSDLRCRAMLCLPEQISTRIIDKENSEGIIAKLQEIKASLSGQHNIGNLLQTLKKAGAKNAFISQVFDTDGPKSQIIAYVSQASSQKVIETMFLSGRVSSLYCSWCQSESLEKKTVAIPYGKSKTLQSCRVFEWYFGNKIVKAEPDSSDLALLGQNTGHAIETTRQDVLKSWQAWRDIKAD